MGGAKRGEEEGEGWKGITIYKEERFDVSTDASFSPNEFRLKWVDDTHALGIFAGSRQGKICY